MRSGSANVPQNAGTILYSLLYNRSLSPTLPRAEFFVRRKVNLSPMLRSKQVLGHNTKNVIATAVQNGAHSLTPNR